MFVMLDDAHMRRHTSPPSATPDTELPPLVADIAPVPQFALESRALKDTT